MIMGIDIGGTNTQGVLFDGKKLVAKKSIDGNRTRHAVECFSHLEKNAKGMFRLMLTGGGCRKIKKEDLPVPFRTVSEIKAIGKGGEYLSGKRSIFVTSIGTGTAFVSVRKGKTSHLGGTGVGGGTIKGLSSLMIKGTPDDAEKLAKKGKGMMDLTVGDIVGKGIGKIPASATASNFGNACGKSQKSEISLSTLKMIGETIGVMSYFAAKTASQEKSMLLSGRVSLNPFVKKCIADTVKLMGGKAEFPKNAEYCAAIGAALL